MIRLATVQTKYMACKRWSTSLVKPIQQSTVNCCIKYGMGKCIPKSILIALKEKQHFTDGTNEIFDVVIACTGFVLAHPFFDKNFLDYSDGPVPLYLKMFHAEIQTLLYRHVPTLRLYLARGRTTK